MLKLLYQWRVRVLVPKRFEKAIPVFRHSAREELATALHPSEADELGWLFRQRKRAATQPAFVPDHRFVEATSGTSTPRAWSSAASRSRESSTFRLKQMGWVSGTELATGW